MNAFMIFKLLQIFLSLIGAVSFGIVIGIDIVLKGSETE